MRFIVCSVKNRGNTMADATLVGVFVGGVVSLATTLCSTVYFDSRRRCQEANAAASIFRGCMTSLVNLINRRNFIERLRRHAHDIRNAKQTIRFEIRAQRNYQQLFDSNIDRVGILQAPLPELICRFYILTSSALEACAVTLGDDLWLKSPNDAAAFLDDLAAILDELCLLKNETVLCIDSIYPKRDLLARTTYWVSRMG